MVKRAFAPVEYQLASYDRCIDKVEQILTGVNPIRIFHDYNEQKGRYSTEVKLFFSNVMFNKPLIHENNGSTKPMTPADARLRNLTYSSNMYVDMKLEVTLYSGENMDVTDTQERKVTNVNIGRIPVMVMSKLCVLRDRTHIPLSMMGECKHEQGGYFIINGSEKVVINQERQAENTICCFRNTRTTKYSHVVEIRSVSTQRAMSPRALSVKITSKDGLMGRLLYVSSSKFRNDIPLFILFRALGLESDRDIVERVVYDVADPTMKPLLQLLQPSLEESSTILTQHCALEWLAKQVQLSSYTKEQRMTDDKRIRIVRDALNIDILPHLDQDHPAKAFFLGRMVRKLLLFYLGYIKEDDRDSYTRKRIDTAGVLLANLFRQYTAKFVKEIRSGLVKEMNTGNWKYNKSVNELLNDTNLYKIVKTTTIDSGLKYSLATGTWGMKNLVSSRSTWTLGVAHVLSRLSYYSTISHLRRVNTPIDKTSKITAPRKLHGNQWGYMCPCETPEGASIGVVKNMSLLCTITSDVDPLEVTELLLESAHVTPFIPSTNTILPTALHHSVQAFVNGVCVAFTDSPAELIEELREYRRRGVIHPHTSISWDISQKELHVHTEAGRVTRPLVILNHGVHRFTEETKKRLQNNSLTWTEMLIGYHDYSDNLADTNSPCSSDVNGRYHPSVVEYIDAHEAENTMVSVEFSFDGEQPRNKTHSEIHPSLILGVIASTICFPDHNQSPRNTYQSAMGKQAMGLYCTNFSKRLDSLGNILHYPMVPMVQTKVANMIHQDDMPNGANAIVAIMSYSGFNQEDSLLICKNAVDRGFYHSTFYRTYKDDERKNQVSGEEEKFMLPDPTLTRGLKPGSYHAINKHGFARPNTPLRGGDVIIGKTVPIRDGGKHTAQHKPFHDQSTTLRHNESGVVDTSFESCNGDGYRFVKVRVRSIRVPGIGDKFSSCHGQKGTVGMVFSQEDMPFIAETGIVPDIIINPHCIPSRMTMGQLYETVLSKCGVHLGRRGDGTAFNGLGYDNICDLLDRCGMERHGNERLVHGQTGEQIPCEVFMGPLYEQRLKHMVDDKIHSRSTGPKVMLTRQPAEGRSRDGGLRVGEMERDCMIGHGVGSFLKESMLDRSDRYEMHVGRKCGLTSVVNTAKNIVDTFSEDKNDSKDAAKVQVPYAFKLLSQELQAMAIAPRLRV